ncbi:MAG: hypothetical protein K0A99_08400 [Desulfoarculaceae bacterium]|nr:hypothetical protein [Desulfoarculaceae bacterium]
MKFVSSGIAGEKTDSLNYQTAGLKDMSRQSIQGAKSILKYLITPLLFSVYPVIFLYTHNIQILTLGQLTVPLLFAIALAALTFIAYKLILKLNITTSLATVGFLILFWNYALFFSGITYFLNLNHWHILPLLLFIYGHLVYLICNLYKRFNLENLHKIVFAVVSVLIIFNLITMLPTEAKKYQITSQKKVHQEMGKKGTDSGNYPDIYLIILDEYASLDTIKEEWGYDNNSIRQFLKNKGFYFAEKSEFRYTNTHQNMPSLLNLEYITGAVEKEIWLDFQYEKEKVRSLHKYEMLSEHSSSDLFEILSNNRLMRILKQYGYKNIVLEGISQHYEAVNFHDADTVFSYQDMDDSGSSLSSFSSSEFREILIENTFIYPFLFANAADNRSYLATKYVLDYLKTDQQIMAGPKFVYAHIMSPHNPYVFDREGNFKNDNPHDSADFRRDPYVHPNKSVNKAYLEQYIYITSEIVKIIDIHFKNGNPTNKIFIIQNDHGPRPHELYLKDRTQPFKAFNAVYFPDGDYTDFYGNIAPVNTLRVVLNKYFGENFEMLEDR